MVVRSRQGSAGCDESRILAYLGSMERKQAKAEKPKNADLRSDGWERFERAIDAAVKAGPQHKAKKKPQRKGR